MGIFSLGLGTKEAVHLLVSENRLSISGELQCCEDLEIKDKDCENIGKHGTKGSKKKDRPLPCDGFTWGLLCWKRVQKRGESDSLFT